MQDNKDLSVVVDNFKQMVTTSSWKTYIDMLKELLDAVNLEILDGKSIINSKALSEDEIRERRNRRLVILEFIEFVPRFIKQNSASSAIDIELDPYDKPEKPKTKKKNK